MQAVACASTGDTSASLAAYAAAAGIPAIVILPRGKVTTAQLVQPLANGATVLSLDTDFDGCMAIVQRLAGEGRVYLANSMNSLRLEGQKTVAIEIVQQFDWQVPDVVIIPGGNLGNVSALGRRLRHDGGARPHLAAPPHRRRAGAGGEPALPRLPARMGRSSRSRREPTLASAIQIGNPVSVKKAIRTLQRYDGIVEQASEQELADAAAEADRTGMFNCPHTGVALAVLKKLVARGEITGGQRVVVISTANGLKFTDFKIGYHDGALPGSSPTTPTGRCCCPTTTTRSCARSTPPPLRRRRRHDRTPESAGAGDFGPGEHFVRYPPRLRVPALQAISRVRSGAASYGFADVNA